MKIFKFWVIVAIATIVSMGFSCSSAHGKRPDFDLPKHAKVDTILVKYNDQFTIDSLVYICDTLSTIANSLRDDLNAANAELDSVNELYFIAKYKLERIQYYTDIVTRKPNQHRFYEGWVKRVLNDEE